MQLFDQEMLVLSGLVDAGGPVADRLRYELAQAIDTVLARGWGWCGKTTNGL